MNINPLKWLRNKAVAEVIKSQDLTNEVLRSAPEDKLRIEMVSRDSSQGKTLSTQIKKEATFFQPKTVKEWNNAVALATDPDDPKLSDLSLLYDNLMLDAHLMSVIESRVMRVLRSKWDLIDKSGNANSDLKLLLEKPWFESFMYHAVMSKFTGIKVLELFDTTPEGELVRTTSMPMGHILHKRKEIAKEVGAETGVSYIAGAIANYYIEIDNNGDLGVLSQIATYVLAKKQAMGAWLDYLHKFGVPPLIINTDNYTTTRAAELLAMGMEMHNNHVMVLQGNETFTIGQTPGGNNTAIFKEFLDLLNSEISKRILGQDGTTQNKDGAGTYGSLKVMQEVADDRHESDKLFVKYVINRDLIPRLPKISSFYSSLSNYQFDWDESDELDQQTYVESAVKLTQAGFELDIDELSERSGITIKGFRAPFSAPDGEEVNTGGNKKKSPITPSK